MSQKCRDDIRPDPVCGLSVEGHTEQVLDLLPQGRAWPRDPDSTLYKFWSAFAEVIKYAEDRLCALADEFFCSTTSECVDIWAEQYGIEIPAVPGIDDVCLKPGADPGDAIRSELCGAVSAQGGNTADYFEEVATNLGWVVSVEDSSQEPYPVCGCWALGVTHLGPTPAIEIDGGPCLGTQGLTSGLTGRAVDNEDVAYWRRGVSRSAAECGRVPGNQLGLTPLGSDCCNHAGYYEWPDGEGNSFGVGGICSGHEFALGGSQSYVQPLNGALTLLDCHDDTGVVLAPYTGHAHHWTIIVDMPASMVEQAALSPFVQPYFLPGCSCVGDPCARLRSLDTSRLEDAINQIKPAHTVVAWVYRWN